MDPGGAKVMTQLRRGVLEHCVLALMDDRSRYGFELVSDLSRSPALVITEGTVYPLLARLRRDGLVVTTWEASDTGPPRRYYGLSEDGRRALRRFREDWQDFRDAVDSVLGTGSPTTPAPPCTRCRGDQP